MSCVARVPAGVRARRAPITRRSAGLLFAALCLPGLSACEEGCGGEQQPPSGEPSVLIQSTSRRVEADGVTFAEVTIRAYDANFDPDDSAVTVTVDRGSLSSEEHTVSDDGGQLTGTPAQGQLKLRFTCESLDVGPVTITASNANASATSTIECIEPSGTITLSVLTDPEDPCTNLIADGDSYCVVPVRVILDGPNIDAPQAGVNVTATVTGATLTDVAAGQDPTVNNLALLTSDDDNGQLPQAQVTVSTDAEGYASLRVHSRLNQPMTIQLQFTGTAATGQAIDQTTSVVSAPFTSAARVFFNRDQVSVGSEQALPLTVNAVDYRGATPADGGAYSNVTVRVPAGSGAALRDDNGDEATELVLPLTSGSATVTFVAPSVQVQTPITVTASYLPHESLPATSGTIEVKVYPEDSLLLNAALDNPEINATENTVATITANVTEYALNTESPADGVSVRFTVSALSRDKIILGERAANQEPGIGDPAFPPVATVVTDAQGQATITVSSRNSRVSGNAAVHVEVLDGGQVVDSQTLSVLVARDPLLQSIVFIGAEPPQIGVRGSAYASSSVVTFQLFDDLANPLPNIDVAFSLSATTDPGATVVANGTTNANGIVSTTLSAGTIAASVKVIARATYGQRTLTTESEPIAITGGLPSFANSYLICKPEDQAQLQPASIECIAHLVDRFTNRAPANLAVQFRAEGGNINPFATTGAEGSATATFVQGNPGMASASLLSASGDSWSYGAIVPWSAAETAQDDATRWNTAAEAACFDPDSGTPCSVFDLCFEAEHTGGALALNQLYCPLLVDGGEGCWNRVEAGVITGDATHFSDGLLASLGLTRAEAQDVLDNDLWNPLNYFGDPSDPVVANVRGLIDGYLDTMFACGAPASCLTGVYGGVSYIAGDECLLAPGCMDFSRNTHCPQDGLITIVATTRGEESFIDVTGNGILDFQDLDANGRHDPGEPILERADPASGPVPFENIVVDLPEAFLDKDNNCYADDHVGSLRLSASDAIRRSDLYNDEDGSGDFGYASAQQGASQLTNGYWDRDKEIMLTDYLLVMQGSASIEGGISCDPADIGDEILCEYSNQTRLCASDGEGGGVLLGCWPELSNDPDLYVQPNGSLTVKYRWVDANGNCYSPKFTHYAYAHDATDYSSLEEPPDPVFVGTKMDSAYCGFGRVQDPRRPWCEAMPALGRAAFSKFTLNGICHEGETGLRQRQVLLQVTPNETPAADGSGSVAQHTFSASVNCP